VVAGAMIVARTGGREAADLIEILLAGPGSGLLCFLAAAGAVLFGALGVLMALLAFIFREEDDDRQFRRRGFPKGLPILLIVLSLVLVWFARRCAPASAPEAPVAVTVEPDAPPADDLEGELQGGEPIVAAPPITAAATAFSWSYKNPLIREGGAGIWVRGEGPFTDDAEARALLCGKAWVAVTGSASEEGPADRNAVRSRLRAVAADNAASQWIKSQSDCVTGALFAVDLGQHAAGVAGDAGAATAYQRQVLVISRARQGDEFISASAARAELAAFLADPASRAALLGGRRFPAEPVILPQ